MVFESECKRRVLLLPLLFVLPPPWSLRAERRGLERKNEGPIALVIAAPDKEASVTSDEKIDLNTAVQTLAMIGVMGSLIFVGLQMKQSQEIAGSAEYNPCWLLSCGNRFSGRTAE